MREDCGCSAGCRALLARLQAVFTQLHSVGVAVTVGCQMTRGSDSTLLTFLPVCTTLWLSCWRILQNPMPTSHVEVMHVSWGHRAAFTCMVEALTFDKMYLLGRKTSLMHFPSLFRHGGHLCWILEELPRFIFQNQQLLGPIQVRPLHLPTPCQSVVHTTGR